MSSPTALSAENFVSLTIPRLSAAVRKAAGFAGFLLLLLCSFSMPTQSEVVKDLRYGVALYQFFQRDYFSALTEVKAAIAQNKLPNHYANARLLQGGMSLSYGINGEAAVIFSESQQLGMSREQHLRAWLYLAKSSNRRNAAHQSEEALSHLQKVYFPYWNSQRSNNEERSPADSGFSAVVNSIVRNGTSVAQSDASSESAFQSMLDEAIYMTAMHNLMLGKTTESAALIAQSRETSIDRPYYYFNRGAVFAQQQRWAAAVESFEKAELLLRRSKGQHALRDRVNTAAGFAYLSDGKYANASRAFERVGLDSVVNSKALLGYGLAQIEQAKYVEAMASWRRLRQQALLLAPVQAVFLGIPYLYERLERPGIALQEYEYAVSTYKNEIILIDEALHVFSEMPLTELFHFEGTDNEWLPILRLIPIKIENHFLVHLLSLNPFQAALLDYRDINRLTVYLEESEKKIGMMQGINNEQNDYWESLVSSDPNHLEGLSSSELRSGLALAPKPQRLLKLRSRFESLVREKERLEEELMDAEKTITGRSLVPKKYTKLWQRLDRAKVAIKDLETTGKLTGDESRVAGRFEGLLLWNASENYAKNRRKIRRQQASLGGALDDSHKLLENIALVTSNRGSNSFASQLVEIQGRTRQQKKQATIVLDRLERKIRQLAVSELEVQKTQLKSHLASAILSVARLHDVGRADGVLKEKNDEAIRNVVKDDLPNSQSGASDD